jgi:magnesium chelatase family protein
MVTQLISAGLHGVDAFRVDVELDCAGGLPQYTVVGLPGTSVRESGSRVRAALHAVGQEMPARRVTVNLAPADRRKSGAAFDLPIALGILGTDARFDLSPVADLLVVGELGLEGAVRPVRGVLAMAALARELGLRGVLVPAANGAEAAVVEGITVHTASHLAEVLRYLAGDAPLASARPGDAPLELPWTGGDLADVRGQHQARRALEVAVAGNHNLLMMGPPGIGKTMLARRVPGILPPMSREEAIEVTRIYSAAGLAPSCGLVTQRPFRSPHHSASAAALIGGGSLPRPGEASLAHRGILFLDELPEFPRHVIECLRQPIEEHVITIGRAAATIYLPACFHLVAAANPCPCGWLGSDRSCKCMPTAVERYQSRLSGPLLDRIDLQVQVDVVQLVELRGGEPGESSAAVRARVQAARARMTERLARHGFRSNGEMDARTTRATCQLTTSAERILASLCLARPKTTARTIDRLIRVARTIADLRCQDVIGSEAMTEAATYRMFDSEPLPGNLDLRAGRGLRVGAPGPDAAP